MSGYSNFIILATNINPSTFMLLASDVEKYMLPCLNKKLFGVECMGCGLQRSIALLLQGEFVAAFKMYPAIYTLVLFVLIVIINMFKPIQNSTKIITILAIVNVSIIIGSYLIKILT